MGHDIPVKTDTSLVLFDSLGRGLAYHAIQPDGHASKNAFLLRFNNIREVDVNGNVILEVPREAAGNWTVTVSEPSPPKPNTNLIYEEAYQVDIRSTSGIVITFWVFTKEQEVVDVETNRTISVTDGSVKYSLYIPFWPFSNDQNKLELSSNLTTLIPDTITNCYFVPSQPDISAVVCSASEIQGSVQLLNKATRFNYVTTEAKVLSAEILFLICPLEDINKNGNLLSSRGAFCPVDLSINSKFPEDLEIPSISSISSSDSDENR